MHLVAIDPLALILSNEVYVKINLPRPPPDLAAVRELLSGLDASQKTLALERTRQLGEYVKVLEKALSGPRHFGHGPLDHLHGTSQPQLRD